MSRKKCDDCSKPLGNSADGLCHECGGETYRNEEARDRVSRWYDILIGKR